MSRRDEFAPLVANDDDEDVDFGYDEDDDEEDEVLLALHPSARFEARMADRLSVRLLAVPDDDEEAHDFVLRQSLGAILQMTEQEEDMKLPASTRISFRGSRTGSRSSLISMNEFAGSRSSLISVMDEFAIEKEEEELLLQDEQFQARQRFTTMVCMALMGLATLVVTLWLGVEFIGPPNQPVGPYRLVERQEGTDFLNYYTFYDGRDSVGSNGYNMYVGHEKASRLGIVNVTMELDELDVYNLGRKLHEEDEPKEKPKEEPFIYMGSSSTKAGPRDSIRLEGIRRFDRGLFM
jgi:hypothetical protein